MRKLVILIQPTKKPVQLILSDDPKEVREIIRDHRSVKGNTTITIPVDAPELCLKSIDVAWSLEDAVIPGASEARGGLQTALQQLVIASAKNHKKILSALSKARKMGDKSDCWM